MGFVVMRRASSEDVSAIILAAGVGRRLGRPLPKVMLEFGGRTLLERHLGSLHAHGVRDIAVTVGYEAGMIRRELERLGCLDSVSLLHNPRYEEGSIVSLSVQRARLEMGRTVLLMDGDVLYDPRLIGRLLATKHENALLFDEAIEPGDEPVKICLRGGRIVDFRKKPERPYERHGESVGFFRFSPAIARALADRVAAYLGEGRRSVEYEEPIRELILAYPERFGYEDVSGLAWTEIDFESDVARARDDVLPRLEGRR